MKILFIICFVLSIAAPIILNKSFNEKRTRFTKIKALISSIVCGIVVLTGFIDFTSFGQDSPLYFGLFTLAISVGLQMVIIVLNSGKNEPVLNFARKAVIAASILELAVFQIPSYSTMFSGKYEKRVMTPFSVPFKAPDDRTTEPNIQGLKVNGFNEVTFMLDGLDIPVGAVKVNTELLENTKFVDVSFDISDATFSSYRSNIASGEIVRGNDRSNYVSVNMSGDVKKMQIRVRGRNASDQYIIKGIVINPEIPFDVHPVRYLLIIILSTLAYAIVESKLLNKPAGKSKNILTLAIAVLTLISGVVSYGVVTSKLPYKDWSRQFRLEDGDQMTQELVDSFEQGKISIDAEISPEFAELENPYDWSERLALTYPWDHLYYNNKIYSYYGIAPVVLFFMPYHAITGYYFSASLAILIFCMVGILFLGLTYYEFIKRFFAKIPVGCAIAGYIVMLLACGVWYNVYWALFYMTAISAGFMFLTIGAYCLLSSGIFGDGKISLVRTALSSLFIGLAVLSRPTLALYAVCVCIIYALNLKQSTVLADGKNSPKRKIIYGLCAALPLASLGAVQMIYNAARFGSPFDFGIRYSLTINDFTNTEVHLVFVMLCLFHYLIAPPAFSCNYPFVSTEFNEFNANGYYYRCQETVSGILFMALPVIGYIFSGRVLKRLPDKKSRIRALAAVGLPCVVMPLIIICCVWESGYAIRYIADFGWEIVIGALAVLFYLYTNSRNETKKRMFRQFMAISVIAAVIINCPQIIYYWFPKDKYPEFAGNFENMIAFWK